MFATPSSGMGSTRAIRSNIAMTSHKEGNFCVTREVTLDPLADELLHHLDDKYLEELFLPAKKIQGKIARAKNHHILKTQIHLVPKIEQLIYAFEEIVGGITVDSVWLLKKSKDDDGFQGWHQDMKHKISMTIVVIVGVATVSTTEVSEDYKEDERKPTALKSPTENSYNTDEEIAAAAKSPTKKNYYTDKEIDAYMMFMAQEEKVSLVQEDKESSTKDDQKPAAKDHTSKNNDDFEVFHGGEVEAWDPTRSELGKVSDGYGLFSIEEGWARKGGSSNSDYLPCCLYCKDC